MPIVPEFDGTNGYAVALARIAEEAEARTGSLDLARLGLEALPPDLARVGHLETLDCSDNPLASLDGLQHCPELQSLDCWGTEITSLDGLHHCTQLQSLDCSFTQITSLDGLQHCPQLQSLICSETQITSLDGLQHCPKLQSLNFSDTEITSLDGLQHCPELQSLTCWGTQITSLDGLQHCAKLQRLDCSFTQITDLTPLSACLELKTFEAHETRLTTVPPGFWDRPTLEDINISSLNGVPRELLSESYVDNCLQRLRNYLTDLETGRELIRDVKLFLLGNGGTGKTQMARHLRREAFNPGWDSTHGIQVTTTTLTGDEDQPESTILHLWDFGGQELYHSTHTLFLRSRALFALLWSVDREPKDASTMNVDAKNFLSRTYPRQYWLDHIAEHAGTDSPVLLVQSKCDTRKDQVPVPSEEGEDFDFLRTQHFGAKNGYQKGQLLAALREAVAHLRKTDGYHYVGHSWMAVQRDIEALRAPDGTYSRDNQRRDQAWFADLCAQHGVQSAPETLRTYLHRCGVIFYQPGLFGDQIIIDQTWAISAIYALFGRDEIYTKLRERYGRFKLSDLSNLVWDAENFTPDEQQLFLSFMETCGICFEYQESDEEKIYLAPDLLPDRSALAVDLSECWDSISSKIESHSYDYSLLHRSIMRAIICRIGQEAKMHGRYWRDGLYVYEETTRSRACITQIFGQRGGNTAQPWAGTLSLEVKGERGDQLFNLLRGWIDDINRDFGVTATAPEVRQPPDTEEEFTPKFAEEPASDYALYVSYCWKDLDSVPKDEKALIEAFMEEAAKRGIAVRRDNNVIRFGDKLKDYMKNLTQGQRIFVFLSKSYLESPNCMYELYNIWEYNKQKGQEFMKKVRIYKWKDLKIKKPQDISIYSEYWKREYDEQTEDFKKIHPGDTAPELRDDYNQIQQFYQNTATILSTISGHLQANDWGEFIEYGLDDLAPLTPQTASPPPRTAPPRP